MSLEDGGANLPGDALEQLVGDLALHLQQQVRERDVRNTGKPREIELQFQVQASGVAGAVPAFEPITLSFDYALHYAPGQRDSSLEYPHFTYGSQTNPAVAIHATVEEWVHDENNGSIVGAVVGIAAIGEGAFTGVVHLTFQGFGSVRAPIAGEE